MRLTVTPGHGTDGPEEVYRASIPLDQLQSPPQDKPPTTAADGLTTTFSNDMDALISRGITGQRRLELLGHTAIGREVVARRPKV
jgi:hypothetical protein